EESFDPIPRTPKESEDDDNNEEDQGLSIGEEERMNEEEEVDELYRLESIFTTGLTTVTPIPSPQSIMTPSFISTFITASQLPTPPTQIPSLDLQSLLTFTSVFRFEDRVKFLEDNFSNIPGIVNQYMHQQIPEAFREAVQTQTDRLQDSIQRENDEFLKTINENMRKIIKEQTTCQMEEPSHPVFETENANLIVPVPPNGLHVRITQELNELCVILAMIDSHLGQPLNDFINSHIMMEMDDLESDDGLADTPLVSPFLDSDDGEVLNKLDEYGHAGNFYGNRIINNLDGKELAFPYMIGFRKFVTYFDPFLTMNIITRKAYNAIMVEGLESTGKNLVAIVRGVYVFAGSVTYVTDFIVNLSKIQSLDYLNSLEVNLIFDLEDQFKEEETKAMAETMEEYTCKTRGDYGSGVTRPKIDDKDHFELKGQFLKELRDNTFNGSDHEDENEHIEKVLEIVNLFHIPNINQDQIILRAFHMSLTRAASHWLRNKPSSLITTWEGLNIGTEL
nr:hypothetical protein [Tanacetum cinerariifolium]